MTVDGVLYPRASALGGCTAHNAMIFVAPHNDDWDAIAALTGDDSWRATEMRRYFERIEDCRHRPFWRWLGKLGINPTRHGWRGWLSTESRSRSLRSTTSRCCATLFESARAAFERDGHRLEAALMAADRAKAIPTTGASRATRPSGYAICRSATRDHRRVGTRERLLDVARRHPDRLRIITGALATRVRFDGDRAAGVEFLRGDRLYGAGAHRRKRRSQPGPSTRAARSSSPAAPSTRRNC